MAGGTLAGDSILVTTSKSRTNRRNQSGERRKSSSRTEESSGRKYSSSGGRRVAPLHSSNNQERGSIPNDMAARDKMDDNAATEQRARRRSRSRKGQRVDPGVARSGKPTTANKSGRRSTKSATGSAATPDFITQTDRYGNASTPRSSDSIRTARIGHPSGRKPHLHVKNGVLVEEESVEEPNQLEACAETVFDSIRLMCCCLSPPDQGNHNKATTQRRKSSKVATTSADDDHTESTSEPSTPKLLPQLHPEDHGKKCLVLDLDETLVHSSFRAVPGADFVIPVQIEDVVHFVYVSKRPGVDDFLVEMAKHYEIVIYTASLNKYADPLLDLLDPHKTIRTRLFRESCVYYEGNYVKDLSLLDRDLSQTIIVDNSPSSYIFHPENAIDCSSYIDDPTDRELDQIGSFLKDIREVQDVRAMCQKWKEWPVLSLRHQQ